MMTPLAVPRSDTPGPSVWRVAILAGMASYLDAGVIVTSGGAFVLFKDALGLSLETIGRLSGLLTLMFAIGALIGGRLGDRFGRRRVFAVTMIGLAVGIAIMLAAQGPSWLYVGTIVTGFCIGADLPVSMAMIAEVAPEGSKGRMVAFSHVLWMAAIGVVQLCQVLVGGMGATGGRIMWLHLLVVAVAVLVLRSRVPESTEWAVARQDIGDAGGASTRPTAAVGFRDLLRPPFVYPLVGLALFYGIVNLSANTGGQFSTLLYTELAGMSVSAAGSVGLLVLAVSFLSALLFMRVIDGRHRMAWFLAGGILYTVAQALPLLFGISAWTLMGWQILSGIGGAIAGEPMWKIWSQELFPTLLRATSQGMTAFFTRVLASAAALVTPMLMVKGPAVLFTVLTGAVAFTTCLGWFYLRRMPNGEDVQRALDDGASARAAVRLT